MSTIATSDFLLLTWSHCGPPCYDQINHNGSKQRASRLPNGPTNPHGCLCFDRVLVSLVMILLFHIFGSAFGVPDIQLRSEPTQFPVLGAQLMNDQGTADQVDEEHESNRSVEPQKFCGLI